MPAHDLSRDPPGAWRDSLIGQQFDGKYRLVRKLGSGGMGSVYEARYERLSRRCALKILRSDLADDARFQRRFLREAQALGAIEHENIVSPYDVGVSDDLHYLVMEYLEGETLRQRIEPGGSLSVQLAIEVAVQVARGLKQAHKNGIVHRDLKPENVMLTRHADGRVLVKLLDFGIASLAERAHEALTTTGRGLGTPHYMSPEQARGEAVDARTDVHAVGSVLYEMLSGRRPYEGESRNEVLYRVMTRPPLPLETHRPDLPKGLLAFVDRALSKEPEQRFRDGASLLEALEAQADAPAQRTAPNGDFDTLGALENDDAPPDTTRQADAVRGNTSQNANAFKARGVLFGLVVGIGIGLGALGFSLFRFSEPSPDAELTSEAPSVAGERAELGSETGEDPRASTVGTAWPATEQPSRSAETTTTPHLPDSAAAQTANPGSPVAAATLLPKDGTRPRTGTPSNPKLPTTRKTSQPDALSTRGFETKNPYSKQP